MGGRGGIREREREDGGIRFALLRTGQDHKNTKGSKDEMGGITEEGRKTGQRGRGVGWETWGSCLDRLGPGDGGLNGKQRAGCLWRRHESKKSVSCCVERRRIMNSDTWMFGTDIINLK